MANANIVNNRRKKQFDLLPNQLAVEVLERVASWILNEISKLLNLASDEEKILLEELRIEQNEAYKLSRDATLSQQQRDLWYERATKASETIRQIAKSNKVKTTILSVAGMVSIVATIVVSIINPNK